MTARKIPAAIGVRSAALPAWDELQTALRDTSPTPCNGSDEWTSDSPEIRAYAARACRGCIVLDHCQRFAEANKETAGVWAGIDRTPALTAGRQIRRTA